MQDKERFEFTYAPPRWPRVIVLLFAVITLAALLSLPLVFLMRAVLLAATALVLLFYWQKLRSSPIQKVLFSDGLWYVLLVDQTDKQLVTLTDYSRPLLGYVILRFDVAKHRPQAVYLDANNIGEAAFRAVCRRLIVEV